jgi:hydrogenase-4 component F
MYTHYLVWLLLVPFFLSLVAFSMRFLERQAVFLLEIIHLVSITAVLVLSLLVLQGVLVEGKVVSLNDWLHVDALAAIFLLIVAVVGFLVGIYSLGYIRNDLKNNELEEQQVSLYYGLYSLFIFTMLMAVTSNNIIMMWVAIEATTLGSAFLVGIYKHRSSLEATWKYVIICTVGVAFGLYGTILVYSDAVNFLQEPGAAVLWTEIVQNARALDPNILKLAFVFVMIGFGTKAGIFPMHAWLPDAHSEAPSPVSALLSGVLLNCALLIVIRFSIIITRGIDPQFTQTIFLAFGVFSLAASALFIFVQQDIKRLLAYSSVENIGLIVLGLGVGGQLGILAAFLHAINHSLVKALMFCTSGNILMKYHTRDLTKIKGMLKAAPFTGLLMIVGILALVGSPPFNIFISKLGIISAGFQSGQQWLMIVCLLFLAVIFTALMRVISSSVFGEVPADVPQGEFRTAFLLPLVVLVILVVALGLYIPPQISTLLNQATSITMSGNALTEIPNLFAGQAHAVFSTVLQQVGFTVP